MEKDMAAELAELDMGTTPESFQRLLESQRELFHGQIEQLQKIVVMQCKLTGVNPLSQEMAAGALSIKIGKRPRDLVNPKAIKYMQSVFSIKDNITKKEMREIVALYGITVTQVKQFFAGQRSKVRKLVKASHEEAVKLNTSRSTHDAQSIVAEHDLSGSAQVPETSSELKTVETSSSCLLQEETVPGSEPSDKNFLENVFSLMRKEDTFSGQVKLMEWILQIQNSAVLQWFLTKGGMVILEEWLSLAATEEQTTVLVVILKVLCHLPLHKVLPVQMSTILQIVNRLRFYRTSDISNRARILLSRWSKLFVRSQACMRPASGSSDVQKERIRMQRISELLKDESWQSKIDISDDILALTSEFTGKAEPAHFVKLLTESGDDSSRKPTRSISSQRREKRKVLLVEQPGRSNAGRNSQVTRVVQARPISADDIQKAKLRASFLQSKHNKDGGPNGTKLPLKDILPCRTSKLAQKADEGVRSGEDKDPAKVTAATSVSSTGAPLIQGQAVGEESSATGGSIFSVQTLESTKVPWRRPPEIRINCLWRVGAGEKSKEVEVQTQRLKREREAVYRKLQDIPPNPREPWDAEMDFDDSLTPEVPAEQLPSDQESLVDTRLPSPSEVKNVVATAAEPVPSVNAAAPVSNVGAEPDLELLAVLLKNPDLVFALTSGQGKNMSKEETVALLDLLKTKNSGHAGIPNGLTGSSSAQPGNKSEIPSLSPNVVAPSVPLRTNSWRSEAAVQDVVVKPSPLEITGLQPQVGVMVRPTPLTNSTLLQTPTSGSTLPQQIMPTLNLPGTLPSPDLLPSPTKQMRAPTNPRLQLHDSNLLVIQASDAASPVTSSAASSMPSKHFSADRLNHNLNAAVLSASSNSGKDSSAAQLLPPLLPTPARPPPALMSERSLPPVAGWRPGTGNSVVPTVNHYKSGSKQSRPIDAGNRLADKAAGRAGAMWDQDVPASRNNYNTLPPVQHQPMWPEPSQIFRPGDEAEEYPGGPEFETWSPDRSLSPPMAIDPHHGRGQWPAPSNGSSRDRRHSWRRRNGSRPWHNHRHGNKRDRRR
ncbi:homeobox protein LUMINIDEPENDENS [Nymphaea colorata]|nr:homeobox protein LUMINIDEPENDENS [Nymphaea colorata]XP_031485901.1 homeobox protein LUMINIDEPENDENS [Nymphaea colorata]